MKAALLNRAAGTPTGIWCQEEARVGQNGTHTYILAEIGSRPLMVRGNRRTPAYLSGAICSERAAVIMPGVNTEAMNGHLKEISTHVAPGAHAVLICGGAGWHQTGGRLELPSNITLLPLPPYSPELNPMENVWHYLRANKLCGFMWDSYEAIAGACEEAWNFLIKDKEQIKSTGTRDCACVNL